MNSLDEDNAFYFNVKYCEHETVIKTFDVPVDDGVDLLIGFCGTSRQFELTTNELKHQS